MERPKSRDTISAVNLNKLPCENRTGLSLPIPAIPTNFVVSSADNPEPVGVSSEETVRFCPRLTRRCFPVSQNSVHLRHREYNLTNLTPILKISIRYYRRRLSSNLNFIGNIFTGNGTDSVFGQRIQMRYIARECSLSLRHIPLRNRNPFFRTFFFIFKSVLTSADHYHMPKSLLTKHPHL